MTRDLLGVASGASRLLAAVAFAFVTACGPRPAPPPATLTQIDLFVNGSEGYTMYRIPSLLRLPSGKVLAFAEGRHNGLPDTGDIDLVMKRSDDGGTTWSGLSVVVDVGPDTAGNPAPVYDHRRNRLWMPFCTNPADAPNERRVHITYSDDEGTTWSPPVDITLQVKVPTWSWYATGPGRSIQLSSGRLVVPSNHESAIDNQRRAHVIYSDDGVTWHLGGTAAAGTDESQVVELDDGRLLLNMRDMAGRRRRMVAWSSDQGLSFGESQPDPALTDPSCQASLLRTQDGLFFSNPDSTEPTRRQRLTVRRSSDGGASWTTSRVIEPGPAAYSALSDVGDRTLGCLYEAGHLLGQFPYERLTLALFSLDWLEEPP